MNRFWPLTLQDAWEDAGIVGTIALVENMWRCGARDCNKMLRITSYQGQIAKARWCVDHGAEELQRGLIAAVHGKRIKVIRWYATFDALNWEEVFYMACSFGALEIAEECVQQVKNTVSWDDAFHFACYYGHLYTAQWCIFKGTVEWLPGILAAGRNNHLDIFKWGLRCGEFDKAVFLRKIWRDRDVVLAGWILNNRSDLLVEIYDENIRAWFWEQWDPHHV